MSGKFGVGSRVRIYATLNGVKAETVGTVLLLGKTGGEVTSKEVSQMTNLKQLAKDLLEKAEKATRPKIMACPKCDSTATPDWTERSPDGNSQCSSCKKPSANWAWVKQAPIPLDVKPNVITALARAYLEAVEAMKQINATDCSNPNCEVPIVYHGVARAFLSKWAAPEGEKKWNK